ncbi:MAG: hypothetical protein AAF870_00125 [Pseudomonadota bacterium]
MAGKVQIIGKNWIFTASLCCLLPIVACTGTESNYLQATALEIAPPEPLPPLVSEPAAVAPSNAPSSTSGDIYGALPVGPRDTGTYPDIRSDPVPRLSNGTSADVEALSGQMQALADAHAAGRISTESYNQRLAYLQRLARNHSSDMLEQIGEPAN